MRLPKTPELRYHWVTQNLLPLCVAPNIMFDRSVLAMLGQMPHDSWIQQGRPITIQVETCVAADSLICFCDAGYGGLIIYDSRVKKLVYTLDQIYQYKHYIITNTTGQNIRIYKQIK